MTLSIIIFCHYAECRILFIIMLSVIKLSFVSPIYYNDVQILKPDLKQHIFEKYFLL
jgi:hypothetical protein